MRAPDVWRIACPGCRTARVLITDELAVLHDCFTCGLAASAIAAHGMPAQREESDWGKPGMRAHYQEELARCERVHGAANMSVVRCRAALADTYQTFGEREALGHYRRVIAQYPLTAPDEPVWFEIAAKLGYELKHTSAARLEARGCYELLHQLYVRALGESHVRVADCLRLLGDISRLLERWSDARPCYERELAIWSGATDEAIAAYRASNGETTAIAATTFALYPTHRETNGDFRGHQLMVTRARLASVLVALGEDPSTAAAVTTSADAVAMGDFVMQTDKSFAAAAWLFDLAERLGPATDMELASVRAKAHMARLMVRS